MPVTGNYYPGRRQKNVKKTFQCAASHRRRCKAMDRGEFVQKNVHPIYFGSIGLLWTLSQGGI